MLSPPLARVTPATVHTPTFLPATLTSSSSSSSSPRQACHAAQRPRPRGMRPKYGMAAEGRNAPAPIVTRTAAPRMPANPRYWPARMRAVVPRWPAPSREEEGEHDDVVDVGRCEQAHRLQDRGEDHAPSPSCVASGKRAGGIDARGGVFVHCQGGIDQCRQRLRQVRIGDLISCPTTLGLGDDDPAIAQACQVVGHVRACQVQISGQFRRVSGMVEQGQDDPGSSGGRPVHDPGGSSRRDAKQ